MLRAGWFAIVMVCCPLFSGCIGVVDYFGAGVAARIVITDGGSRDVRVAFKRHNGKTIRSARFRYGSLVCVDPPLPDLDQGVNGIMVDSFPLVWRERMIYDVLLDEGEKHTLLQVRLQGLQRMTYKRMPISVLNIVVPSELSETYFE